MRRGGGGRDQPGRYRHLGVTGGPGIKPTSPRQHDPRPAEPPVRAVSGGPRGDRTHNPRIKRTNELSAVLTCADAPRSPAYEAQYVAVHNHIRRTPAGVRARPTDHEDRTTGRCVVRSPTAPTGCHAERWPCPRLRSRPCTSAQRRAPRRPPRCGPPRRPAAAGRRRPCREWSETCLFGHALGRGEQFVPHGVEQPRGGVAQQVGLLAGHRPTFPVTAPESSRPCTCAGTCRAASRWSGADPATRGPTSSPTTARFQGVLGGQQPRPTSGHSWTTWRKSLRSDGDATWIYPGHEKDTTLGTARPHLGKWPTPRLVTCRSRLMSRGGPAPPRSSSRW